MKITFLPLIFQMIVIFVTCGIISACATNKDKEEAVVYIDKVRQAAQAINQKAKSEQKKFIESLGKIEEACQRKAPLQLNSVVSDFLPKIGNVPVSLTNVDCIYIETQDNSNTLYKYSISPDQQWYIRQEFNWLIRGNRVLFKNPIYQIGLSTAKYELKQITFRENNVFPFRAGSKATMLIREAGEKDKENILRTIKSFVIRRNGIPIETIHVILRDYGQTKVFGVDTEMRRWYLYAENANVVLRESFYITPTSTASLDSTGFTNILFIKNGKLLYALDKQELAPIVTFLNRMDIFSY